MTTRHILQSASDVRNVARELLQLVFAAELLSPSRCIWIVSPWMRDIPVIDNTTGAFQSLGADFPRTEIRLSGVLRELALRGTTIVLATRRDAGNRQVIDELESTLPATALSYLERDALHAKGIVSDRFCLVGSMNLTYNGLERLTEMLVFETDRGKVEQLRLEFQREYGGPA